jgi:type VI secretion system protein ImpK
MSPRFARVVDPILTCVLDLLDRIDRGEECDPAKEKDRINKMFNAASGQLGNAPEWNDLARYALYAWIDSELAKMQPWEGRDWWHTHSLELDFWGKQVANVEFFRKAQEAATLPCRDALEVFYICVVLGYRGFYENMSEIDKINIIETFGFPPDIKTWVAQYAHAVRLGRELPPITDARTPPDTAPPRLGKQRLLGAGLLAAIFTGIFFSFVALLLRNL